MVTLNGIDYNTKTALFSISGTADIANLPTATEKGKNEAASYEACAPGSTALLTDGSFGVYVLDGATNTWKGGD